MLCYGSPARSSCDWLTRGEMRSAHMESAPHHRRAEANAGTHQLQRNQGAIDWAVQTMTPHRAPSVLEKSTRRIISSTPEIKVTITHCSKKNPDFHTDFHKILTGEKQPAARQVPEVNETVPRLTIHKPCPSPCLTQQLAATTAAFLWLVLQQTNAFTLGNGLTCTSQSPRSQSALSCLFYNWDRTTHTLWSWPARVLFRRLLRCLWNSGRCCFKGMNSCCSACFSLLSGLMFTGNTGCLEVKVKLRNTLWYVNPSSCPVWDMNAASSD